ncbi:MAG: hypothetical protein AAF658_08275, partial [Myxococcota bacterium]
MTLVRLNGAALLLSTCIALSGCGGSDELGFPDGWSPGSDPDGFATPGSNPFRDGLSDPTCSLDDDCLTGEVCVDRVCQMQRCTIGGIEGQALSNNYRIFSDREFVIADAAPDQPWLDLYSPEPDAVSYTESWTVGDGETRDIAGGDFLGQRPEQLAVIHRGDSTLKLMTRSDSTDFEMPFEPIAIASGNIDSDALDELVVLGPSGESAICHFDQNECTSYGSSEVLDAKDAAIGDVDGDGYGEVIFLMWADEVPFIQVWNFDFQVTNQVQIYRSDIFPIPRRIAIGETRPGLSQPIIGLVDQPDVAFDTDELIAYDVRGDRLIVSSRINVQRDIRDLVVGNLDGEGGDEIAALRAAGFVEVFDEVDEALSFAFSFSVETSEDPTHIALTDTDGDT